MAQLKDDCFAFGDSLTPVDDALALIRLRVDVVADPVELPIDECLNHVLSQDVIAARSVPPHDNSAVDGYAVYHGDLDPENETRLPVAGRVAAGHPFHRPARHGEAVRIFTGAPMPVGEDSTQKSGPDTVYMDEDVTRDGDMAILPPGLKRGSNRRNAGEDVEAGTVILRKGARLRPQDLGLAASTGLATLPVYAPLRVAVFSTGDEIRDPGGDAPEGCVFDANRFSIKGLLAAQNCRVTDLGILPDDAEVIRDALAAAAPDHDLIVTSGGVSAGEEDHVRTAVEENGSLHLWRLAIKPGRPVALGQVGRTAFVGLPGNPVAVMVTFMIVARPLIHWLSGADAKPATYYPVRTGFAHRKKAGRREWVRVRIEESEGGGLVAYKDHSGGAGILTSMVGADGLLELGEDVESVAEGDTVSYLPFNEVWR